MAGDHTVPVKRDERKNGRSGKIQFTADYADGTDTDPGSMVLSRSNLFTISESAIFLRAFSVGRYGNR
jgi:hypothetical protein